LVLPLPQTREFPQLSLRRPQIGTALATHRLNELPAWSAKAITAEHRQGLGKAGRKMGLEDSLFGVHGKALELRSQRLNLLASNIANASTPGYKARDIDFEAALKDAADKGTDASNAATAAMGYRIPLQPSLDGNTVELSTEQTLFAENAVKYSTTLSFLEARINTITRALRGE
jgi:flagellar basal-body rod protein FlgB